MDMDDLENDEPLLARGAEAQPETSPSTRETSDSGSGDKSDSVHGKTSDSSHGKTSDSALVADNMSPKPASDSLDQGSGEHPSSNSYSSDSSQGTSEKKAKKTTKGVPPAGNKTFLIIHQKPTEKVPKVYIAGNVLSAANDDQPSPSGQEDDEGDVKTKGTTYGRGRRLRSKQAQATQAKVKVKVQLKPANRSGKVVRNKRIKLPEVKAETVSSDQCYACNICQSSFPGMKSLKRHVDSHARHRQHKCDVCQMTFPLMTQLKSHSRMHHGEDSVYRCDKCPLVFSQEAKVNSHQQCHHNRGDAESKSSSRCSVCHRTFLTAAALKRHYRVHNNTGKFTCSVCFKVFMEKKDLVKHSNKSHDSAVKSDILFKCKICFSVFPRMSAMVAHQRQHTNQKSPLQCGFCPNRFNSKLGLKRHLTLHSDRMTKRFKCVYCKDSFDQRRELMAHAVAHSKENPFRCFCKKAFQTKANLVKHLRGHTGVAPFRCGACNQVFVEETQLTKHVKSDHKAAPPKLNRAKSPRKKPATRAAQRKKAASKAKPRKHVKRISKEKRVDVSEDEDEEADADEHRFECYLCSEKFPNKSQLMNHVLKVHARTDN